MGQRTLVDQDLAIPSARGVILLGETIRQRIIGGLDV